MIEEPVKLKKKDQIMLDEEVALKLQAELQAEFEKVQRLASEKAKQEQEVNIALIVSWDDVQAKNKRRKFFAVRRTEEKRNKPPTQAQQRIIMCTYLKNMEGKKLTNLKNKSFDSIQKMFNRAFKRVNTLIDLRTELVEESSNKAEAEIEDDKDTAELKQLVKIIPYEEGVAIDDIPLVVKPPSIVDLKIQKEGKKSYYKIIRATGIPKAPKPSSNSERVPQGTKPEAKPGHKKHSTSLTKPSISSSKQAVGGPTSLGVTNEEGSYPQLSIGNDVSADLATEVDPEIFDTSDSIPHLQSPDEGSKNCTPDHTFAGTNPSVLVDKTKFAEDGSQTVHLIFGSNSLAQILESKAGTRQTKACCSKITTLKAHSSIPNELKEIPTKITALAKEVNELKKHIKEFEIELPKTLEALPGILNKVTDTLNRFSSILNAHNEGVPLANKSIASPAEGQKNTNPVKQDAELANLVDLMGIDVVKEYHKKKLPYNMLGIKCTRHSHCQEKVPTGSISSHCQ
nr:hypothetical protein [Tanacetum cinerariifolium]